MNRIEVIYISVNADIFQQPLQVSQGTSVINAVKASGLYERFPECQTLPHGVFGKPVSMERSVEDGDRIEIYRPLLINPMKKRRLRAQKK